MTDLVKRLRDGSTVPLMEERVAVSDEIERNREDIAELVGILQSAMRHGGLLHMAVARAAITKHSTTTKEQ